MRLAPLLFLLLLPLVELTLLIEIGRRVGSLVVLLLIVGTGLIGAAAVRAHGFVAMRRAQDALQRGQAPAEGLIDGVLIILGGLLLISPGVLCDIAGLVLLVPALRRAIKWWLRRRLEHWIAAGTLRISWW